MHAARVLEQGAMAFNHERGRIKWRRRRPRVFSEAPVVRAAVPAGSVDAGAPPSLSRDDRFVGALKAPRAGYVPMYALARRCIASTIGGYAISGCIAIRN